MPNIKLGRSTISNSNYVTTKRGRHSLVYYRCRRASHSGTCDMRQVPASVLELAVIGHLEMLELEIRGMAGLAQAAEAQFAAEVQPLVKRRSELNRQLERLDTRAQTLLELTAASKLTAACPPPPPPRRWIASYARRAVK